ncbi:MAG: HEAT repeat domain-containing protein [Candidatus Schekmanbacteria bacterium]|nr:HEAT repeat domain-containing protein [Candidatus Schekmanbacteria bacterium]
MQHAELFEEMAKHLHLALIRHRQYPSVHPLLRAAVAQAHEATRKLLQEFGGVTIGTAAGRLIVNGQALTELGSMLERFRQLLDSLHVWAVTFRPELELSELERFLKILADSTTLEQKADLAILLEAAGIRNISVNAVLYRAVSADAAGDALPPATAGGAGAGAGAGVGGSAAGAGSAGGTPAAAGGPPPGAAGGLSGSPETPSAERETATAAPPTPPLAPPPNPELIRHVLGLTDSYAAEHLDQELDICFRRNPTETLRLLEAAAATTLSAAVPLPGPTTIAADIRALGVVVTTLVRGYGARQKDGMTTLECVVRLLATHGVPIDALERVLDTAPGPEPAPAGAPGEAMMAAPDDLPAALDEDSDELDSQSPGVEAAGVEEKARRLLAKSQELVQRREQLRLTDELTGALFGELRGALRAAEALHEVLLGAIEKGDTKLAERIFEIIKARLRQPLDSDDLAVALLGSVAATSALEVQARNIESASRLLEQVIRFATNRGLSAGMHGPVDRILRAAARIRPYVELFEGVVDRNRRQRVLAIKELVKLGPGIVPGLLERLKDDRWFMRRNVVMILGEIGDRAAVSPLAELIGDATPQVRKELVGALGKLGGADVVPLLMRIAAEDSAEVHRQDAVLHLGELMDLRGLALIGEILQEQGPFANGSDELKLEAIRAFAKLSRTEAPEVKKITPLVRPYLGAGIRRLFRKANEQLALAAVAALKEAGDLEAEPHLLEAMAKSRRDSAMFRACADALASLRERRAYGGPS